jgi:protein tyrosine phosphatase
MAQKHAPIRGPYLHIVNRLREQRMMMVVNEIQSRDLCEIMREVFGGEAFNNV